MLSFDPTASSLFSRFNNLFASRGGQTAQSLSQVLVQSRTQSGLTIVTAEGDTVTLSTNTAYQGTGVRYNARGVAEGQALTLRANALESELTSQNQVTIEGDLNEQEIQDIKKIIRQVNGLTQDVKSGDVKAALAHGQQIAATGTIANIDVNIQHAESLKLSQVFEQKGVTNTGQPGQQVSQGGESGAGLVSPQDHLLQGLLISKFLSKPEHEHHDRSPRAPQHEERFNASGTDKSEESLTQKVKEGLKQGVEGLVEFFNKVGEELLRGAEAIAKLADHLTNKVAQQAARIAKAYERLKEYLENGETEKNNDLQWKIDHRVNGLENTVENLSSKINELADNLAGKLTNTLGSQTAEGQSTKSSRAEEKGPESEATEEPAQNPSGEKNKTDTA